MEFGTKIKNLRTKRGITQEAMAHIYEILGEKEKAVECYKLRIKMMREEWGIIAGDDVDQINRCIQKLLEK